MKDIQVVTAVVSLVTSLVNLITCIVAYKKLIADLKQKNPNPLEPDKDSE